MQAIDLWEQLVFVAMEQKGQQNETSDIRQYGNIIHRKQHTKAPPKILQPTQTIGKFRQLTLNTVRSKSATTPKQTKVSSELEIENYMDKGRRSVPVRTQHKQFHLRDFFVIHNNKPHGHRGMACGLQDGATHKINNLIN